MSLIEFFNTPQEKNEIVSIIEKNLPIDYKETGFENLWGAFLYAARSDDLILYGDFAENLKENYKEEVDDKIHAFLTDILEFIGEENSEKYELDLALLTFEIDAVYDADQNTELRNLLFEIVKAIDYEKFEAATENLINMLALFDNGYEDLVSYLENSPSFGEKETTIMSSLANSPIKGESYYKFLRSACKNDDNESILEIILNCVEDYGDAKAVSFLRTLAKKYYEKIDNAAAKGEDTTKYREIFYMILGAVENLGGNTEI